MTDQPKSCAAMLINDEFVEMIEHQAAHLRRSFKLEEDALIDVAVPHLYAADAVRRWGSLSAASEHLFSGRIALRDATEVHG